MSPRLLRLLAALRHRDAAHVEKVFPAARRASILAAILAGEVAAPIPVRRRLLRSGAGRRRARASVAVPAFAALLACVLAAVTVAVVTSSPSARRASPSHPVIHTAPVSFRYPARGPDSGYIVATVTDPLAAQSSLDAAFRAAGLDIAVSLVPASPSAVGMVVEISGPARGPQIETLTGGSCVTGGGGPGNCPIGLKIPRGFSGSGAITLGRPAKPGEAYESTNSVFAPGESLHCSGLIGETVATAMPKLAARDITVQWQRQTSVVAPQPGAAPVATTSTTATTSTATTATSATTTSSAGGPQSDTSAPQGGYHIVDGDPIKPGVVMLQTQADPLTASQLAQEAHMYSAGC